MTDHDPLCQRYEADHWCECALIVRARADERERMQTAIDASNVAEDAVTIALAHAEAVAAKLVEVTCADESLICTLEQAHARAVKQRDAARAEVADLTRHGMIHPINQCCHDLRAAQAEAATLREQIDLPDLRPWGI